MTSCCVTYTTASRRSELLPGVPRALPIIRPAARAGPPPGDNSVMASMQLQEILFSQGFGTRRVCAGLVQQGYVVVAGTPCDDPTAEFEAVEGLRFTVQGTDWEYHEKAYLMLHKPAGYECSQKPSAYPSIYTLLPAPIRQRGGGAAAGVQAVGRLDQDTTGLLLLS